MSQSKYRVLFYREDTDIQEVSKPVDTIEEAIDVALKENPWQYNIEIVKIVNWKVVDEDQVLCFDNLRTKLERVERKPYSLNGKTF